MVIVATDTCSAGSRIEVKREVARAPAAPREFQLVLPLEILTGGIHNRFFRCCHNAEGMTWYQDFEIVVRCFHTGKGEDAVGQD